jgi:hypothetical protein
MVYTLKREGTPEKETFQPISRQEWANFGNQGVDTEPGLNWLTIWYRGRFF